MYTCYTQLGPTEHTLSFLQKFHKEFPKYCVYWIGPVLAEVRTANVETMKRLMLRPGGECDKFGKNCTLKTVLHVLTIVSHTAKEIKVNGLCKQV